MAAIRKRKLKHGKICWQVDYRDVKRKRRHKQFATRRQADDWLVNARSEVASGTHVAASESKTIQEAADEWLKDCERNGLERTTLDVYRQRVNDHIVPFIGHLKLATTTTVDAQNFYESLLDQCRSRDMVRRVRINAGAIFRYAQRKGWVVGNPIALTPYKHSKRDYKRPPMPTLVEMKAMIARTAAAWEGWLVMVYVLIFAGLRASELRALTWDDIDMNTLILTVRQRADRWGRIARPKSDAGTRDIRFVPQLVRELKKWKLRCPHSELNLVFPSSTGSVQNLANIMNRFLRPMQIEAGVVVKTVATGTDGRKTTKTRAKFGMHAFRHFCASLWIDANFSPKRIQTMMGHASIELTFDTYGHLFDAREDDEKAMKKIQAKVLG
jgi:integrase